MKSIGQSGSDRYRNHYNNKNQSTSIDYSGNNRIGSRVVSGGGGVFGVINSPKRKNDRGMSSIVGNGQGAIFQSMFVEKPSGEDVNTIGVRSRGKRYRTIAGQPESYV